MTLTLSGLLVIAPQTPAALQAPADTAAALALFSQAKHTAAGLSAATAAEYWAYIANQELRAGRGEAEVDFRAVFARARALPAALAARKAILELDAVEGEWDAGNPASAQTLALAADAGRSAIWDRLIPAVAARDPGAAWALWRRAGDLTLDFPYRAAGVLWSLDRTTPAEQQQLQAAAPAGLGHLENAGRLEEALDFFALRGVRGLSVCRTAEKVLPALRATAWQRDQLRKRLRTQAGCTAAQLPGRMPLHSPPAPVSISLSAIRTPSPVHQNYAGTVAAAAPDYGDGGITAGSLRKHLDDASEIAFYSSDPQAAAHLAAALLEAGDQKTADRLCRTSLSLAARPDANWSAALRAAGLVAQADFELAAKWAAALPPGLFTPLLQAHVARMAPHAGGRAGQVAARSRRVFTPIHGYWPPAQEPKHFLQLHEITAGERTAAEAAAPPGSSALVDLAANRLVYRQHDVRLWVATGASPRWSYRINGLMNPAIEIPRGSRLTVTIVNFDQSPYDFLVLPHGPPFGPWPNSPIGAWGRLVSDGRQNQRIGNQPLLPPRNLHTIYTVTLRFTVPAAGRGSYLCNFHGLADAGLYGPVVVVP